MARTFAYCCLLLCVAADCATYGYDNFTQWPSTCQDTKNQSPVNVVAAMERDFSHFLFPLYANWAAVAPTLCTCCYYTIPLTAKGSSLILKDLTGQSLVYSPSYVAIHTPSEHLFEGVNYDVEVQIYHSIYSGSTPYTTAAVSLFFSATSATDSPFFQQFVDSAGGKLLNGLPTFSLSSIISQMTSFAEYFLYVGSLTVPPCTENVLWVLLAHTPDQVLSQAQLTAISKQWTDGKNNRPTQGLGSRRIYHKIKF